jgi:hypothetical protein
VRVRRREARRGTGRGGECKTTTERKAVRGRGRGRESRGKEGIKGERDNCPKVGTR